MGARDVYRATERNPPEYVPRAPVRLQTATPVFSVH